MLTFETLLLGLVPGHIPLDVEVGQGVARVIGHLDEPPWRAVVDFGEELDRQRIIWIRGSHLPSEITQLTSSSWRLVGEPASAPPARLVPTRPEPDRVSSAVEPGARP